MCRHSSLKHILAGHKHPFTRDPNTQTDDTILPLPATPPLNTCLSRARARTCQHDTTYKHTRAQLQQANKQAKGKEGKNRRKPTKEDVRKQGAKKFMEQATVRCFSCASLA